MIHPNTYDRLLIVINWIKKVSLWKSCALPRSPRIVDIQLQLQDKKISRLTFLILTIFSQIAQSILTGFLISLSLETLRRALEFPCPYFPPKLIGRLHFIRGGHIPS